MAPSITANRLLSDLSPAKLPYLPDKLDILIGQLGSSTVSNPATICVTSGN
jgi:hypothetical protein